ncbi:hypothetical protein C2G38_2172726 [Gigaspora rosea]|uniref:Uncharacterized protein n=1 Tax=Gigaspora rosea TaxID=44941 RepID=A0A397VPI2_9GLOM|nr:hypothetical protein C2G38_2172726 [Gigaspora rosea]
MDPTATKPITNVKSGNYKTSRIQRVLVDTFTNEWGEITLYNKKFLLELLKLFDGLIYKHIKNVEIIVEIIDEIKKLKMNFTPNNTFHKLLKS